MSFRSGRHFLQIPGPSNVPDRILRAMDEPTIDHRGPEFSQLTREILERLKGIFKTSGPVLIYPTSGTGASEAALVNCLSPGDRVLLLDHGFFASNWGRTAEKLGLKFKRSKATGARLSIPTPPLLLWRKTLATS